MSDVSKVKVNNITYDLKDPNIRDSPTFTGTPTAPTPTAGDDSTKIATTAFVQDELDGYLPLSGGTMTGTLKLHTTNGLEFPAASGYTSDQNGNFTHKRNNTADAWELKNNAGTAEFSVKWETGEITNGVWKGTAIAVANGGTGATTKANARANLGIFQGWQDLSPNDVNVPNNTLTELYSLNLTAGTYLIIYGAYFAANSTGNREIGIGNDTTAVSYGHITHLSQRAADGIGTWMVLTALEKRSTANIYFMAKQNSGSSLSTKVRIRIFKLCD